MGRDAHNLNESSGPMLGTLTVSKLVQLAADALSPAAQMLFFAWLEATRKNIHESRRFLKLADLACKDETERCYVQHLGAMVLFASGDTQMAIEMDRACLELSSRLGYDRLRADVLSHLSALFGALGHAGLATAFAAEAITTDPGRPPSDADEGSNER